MLTSTSYCLHRRIFPNKIVGGTDKTIIDSKWSVESSELSVNELKTVLPHKNNIYISADIRIFYLNVPLKGIIVDETHAMKNP